MNELYRVDFDKIRKQMTKEKILKNIQSKIADFINESDVTMYECPSVEEFLEWIHREISKVLEDTDD